MDTHLNTSMMEREARTILTSESDNRMNGTLGSGVILGASEPR